jgi:hypothetical protein
MCAAGLIDVDAVGRVQMVRAGTTWAQIWQLTIAQLRGRIVDTGLLTDEEMDELLTLHKDPGFVVMNAIEMKVWGKKPD